MSENEFELTDAVFSRVNPNPDRIGCPSVEVLRELALRKRPIEDPAYDHLPECSPCYVRFRELQKARKRVLLMRYAAAAALALALLGVAGFWLTKPRPAVMSSLPERINRVGAVVDLRPFSALRGEEGGDVAAPPVVRRSAEPLAFVLPVGSEPGAYELQVLDVALKPRLTAKGAATLREGTTILPVALDLSPLPAGHYTLGLRHAESDWQFFPMRVN